MNIIKNTDEISKFNDNIYFESPIYITNNKFWDGGINCDSTLEEKSSFYYVSNKMSCIIQDIMLTLEEPAFIGKTFCQNKKMFAHWSDLKKYELFRRISQTINPKKHYKVFLPNDRNIIDLIIESNFRYFSYISLYFPTNNIVCLPTCHTETLIYTQSPKEIVEMLKPIVAKYSNEDYKIIYDKKVTNLC